MYKLSTMTRLLFFVFPLILCSLSLCSVSSRIYKLLPDVPRVKEAIRDGECFFYTLSELRPNTPYEVRVSFLGTVPAHFHFNWVRSTEEEPEKNVGRKLMDTEKVMFHTDERGNVPGVPEEHILRVCAERYTVSYSKQNMEAEIPYSIILETLYLGGAPLHALKLGALILVALVLVYSFLLPRIAKLMQWGEDAAKVE